MAAVALFVAAVCVFPAMEAVTACRPDHRSAETFGNWCCGSREKNPRWEYRRIVGGLKNGLGVAVLPLSNLDDARGRKKNVVAAGVSACKMLPIFSGQNGNPGLAVRTRRLFCGTTSESGGQDLKEVWCLRGSSSFASNSTSEETLATGRKKKEGGACRRGQNKTEAGVRFSHEPAAAWLRPSWPRRAPRGRSSRPVQRLSLETEGCGSRGTTCRRPDAASILPGCTKPISPHSSNGPAIYGPRTTPPSSMRRRRDYGTSTILQCPPAMPTFW